MVGIWSGQWRSPQYWDYFGKRLVEHSEVSAGAHVLDVGTGSGAVLFRALEKIGRSGQIIGIDIRYPKEAAAKLREKGLNNGQFAQMDAECMGFRDAIFDVVLSGFVGWDDIFDFERGVFKTRNYILEEIMRVLKPGGRVGKSGWAFQEDNECVAELVNDYLPNSGERIQPIYGKENEAGLAIILRNSGFKNMRILREEKEFAYTDEAEWIEVMRWSGWNPYFKQIEALPLDRQHDFEQAVYAKARDHKDADGIHFKRIALFTLGVK